MSDRVRERLMAAGAFILAAAAFLPALKAGFVWDDAANLIDNRAYRHFDLRHLRWMFSTFYMGPYQPLSWMTLGLDFHLWGVNAKGFHLTNLLLHGANAALFLLVARRLLLRVAPLAAPQRRDAGAFFAALVFALHPLRAEAVVWVTERREVLAAFFGLWATLSYLRGRLREAFLLYAACLLSKASGVMLPAAWLVIDYYPSGRSDLKRALVEKLPFFGLSALAGLAAIAGQWNAGNLRGLDELGWGARLAESLMGLGFYLAKTVWPAGLSPLYRPPAQMGLGLPVVWLYAAAVPALALLLRLLRVPARAQLALWGVYLALVLPVLGLLQNGPQLAADRYTYLSCLGWAALAGAALMQALEAGRREAVAVAAALCLALGGLSWQRARVWRDDDSLWESALRVDPGSIPARLNYGLALAGKRRLLEATSVYQEAEALAPDNAMLLTHHGWALLELRRENEARGMLEEAVALDPSLAPARTYLGVCLLRQGQPEAALAHLRRAFELQPRSQLALENFLAAQQAVEDAKKAKKTGRK